MFVNKRNLILLVAAFFTQVDIVYASDFKLGFYDSGFTSRAKVNSDADFIVNYDNSVYTLSYLDSCQAVGLKVMVQLPRSYVESCDLDSIESFVTGFQTNGEDHPAILAWYLYDEPDGHNVSAATCKAVYDRVRSLSALPVAATFIYYPWHCMVQEYHKAFDIMLYDEYPYPIRVDYDEMDFWRSNTNSSWFAVISGHSSTLNNYGRDFIPIQQSVARGSSTSTDHYAYILRLPTLLEADTMATYSVLCGADSLIWFTYYHALAAMALNETPYPNEGTQWLEEVFTPIEAAFDGIGDALAGGEISGAVKKVNDNRIVVKIYYDPSRDKPIMIAQNMSDQTITNTRFYHNLDTGYTKAKRIGASEDPDGYVWVYSDGMIQDSFAPFQAHTYELNWRLGKPELKADTPVLGCSMEMDITSYTPGEGYYFNFSATNNAPNAYIDKVVLWCNGYNNLFDVFDNTSAYTVTPIGLHDDNANTSNYAIVDFAGNGLAPGDTASSGVSNNNLNYLGQYGLLATVYYSNGYTLQGMFRNKMDTDDDHRDRMVLELTNSYDVRVEVDPYDQYDAYRLRVINNSNSVKVKRVIIEAQSRIFDTTNSGTVFETTPGPASGVNNDGKLAKVLYLDPSDDGLEPGDWDDWSAGDIDGSASGMKATVYFSDGKQISGVMGNLPDADGSNPQRYVFGVKCPLPPDTIDLSSNGEDVILSWSKGENAESYGLYRSRNSESDFIKIADNITTRCFVDTDVNQADIYRYYVKTVYSDNVSNASSTVEINVVPLNNLIFEESFETDFDDWDKPLGQASKSPAVAKVGLYSYAVDEWKDVITKDFERLLNDKITIWFYDDINNINSVCMARVDEDAWNTSFADWVAMGIHYSVSQKNYVYRIGSDMHPTSISRRTGWHELTWDYTSGVDVKMYIDRQLIAQSDISSSFRYISMGDWWGSTKTAGLYFDGVSFDNKKYSDFDGNGIVDVSDMKLLAYYWLNSVAYEKSLDTDCLRSRNIDLYNFVRLSSDLE